MVGRRDAGTLIRHIRVQSRNKVSRSGCAAAGSLVLNIVGIIVFQPANIHGTPAPLSRVDYYALIGVGTGVLHPVSAGLYTWAGRSAGCTLTGRLILSPRPATVVGRRYPDIPVQLELPLFARPTAGRCAATQFFNWLRTSSPA